MLFITGEIKMIVNNPRYIGVTDVHSVALAIDLCNKVKGSDMKMHIGVMTNYSGIVNGFPPDKYKKVWRTKDELAIAFVNHPDAFNVVHYADYKRDGRTNTKVLQLAYEGGGQYCHALQLDMIWPDSEMMSETKKLCPEMKFIMQLGRSAISDMCKQIDTNSLLKLSDRLNKEYSDIADYLLIDFSGGEGILIDTEKTLALLDHLHKHCPNFSYVVAGGLHAENLEETIGVILNFFPDISWDAQGKLRPSGDSTEPLDISFAKKYVEISTYLTKKHRRSL